MTEKVPTTEEFRAGNVIIRQGDHGRAFYVLEKGAVEVVKDDVVLNVLMFPGTIFGEVSAILGKPRTSCVRARMPTTVTKYEGIDLEALVSQHPEIAVKMLETLAGRLEHTTQKLTDSL
ncbi:hypothetical protein DDZ13_01570 [Coraliomargarita sinensis]|uniref:Cyclic nucleotide-binding domain-containing protein n=1 Tax=Coraliomargarita sinensis TaxID=2174842 RepID=A0A317ZP03_9BACT|nr:cyclic nucleotide-binding domain-containing protein [Coraliomargarita sinensis]PXA05589.1 hypothetical protein DDZ13_01570 [Coraliomargarita sinensis]